MQQGSPREDYNPLREDSFPDGNNKQEDEAPDHEKHERSSSSSMEEPQFDYGVTPPSTRNERRHKWRLRSERRQDARHELKNGRDNLKKDRQFEYQAAVVREQFGINMSPETGDDGLYTTKSHSVIKRKHNSRNNSRNRKQARAKKSFNAASAGFVYPTVDSAEREYLAPIEVDCTSRYFSVSSKLINSSDIPSVHMKRPSLSSDVSKSLDSPWQKRCPPDRYFFHEELLTMLKETSCGREVSKSEDAIWQTNLMDLIWLELKAWQHNVSMSQQDDALCEARQRIHEVLEDFLEFKANVPEMDLEHKKCAEVIYKDICVYDSVKRQKVAIDQVLVLMAKLESVENLYPNLKLLGSANPGYLSSDFQSKLMALNLWLNITRDLNHKLKLMSKILYIERIAGKCWPCFDDVLLDDDFVDLGEDAEEGMKSVLTSPGSPASPESAKSSEGPAQLARVFSTLSMEELCQSSMYRYFVERTLKKTGLTKLLVRLRSLLHGSLSRAKNLLQQPVKKSNGLSPPQIYVDLHMTPSFAEFTDPRLDFELPDFDSDVPLHQYYKLIFEEMQLPSFKAVYMLLARIPLGVVHECLKLRLEQRPEREPSLLSVRQLIRECKEVLFGAVVVKQYYRDMVGGIMESTEEINQVEQDIESFEDDMRAMLDVYLNYLQTWVLELQHLPEMSKQLKNALEDEWAFTKSISIHVRGGEAKAGNYFCRLARHMLHSISHYMDTGLDDCIDQLYDTTMNDSAIDNEMMETSNAGELRQMITHTCRDIKELFREGRERAAKALGFAKMLRKDLEMAAAFHVSSSTEDLLDRLYATNHVMVKAPQSAEYMFFVPHDIAADEHQVLQLLKVTCGREDPVKTDCIYQSGYVLLFKCDAAADSLSWRGPTADVDPTADTTIALTHIQVDNLLLVVTQSSQLGKQRKEFEQLMGNVVSLENEHTSCHVGIADSLVEMKTALLDLQEKMTYSLQQVDEKLSLEENVDEMEKVHLHNLYKETLHQCFNYSFEYNKEVMRIIWGSKRTRMTENVVALATLWMDFILTKCEAGRGCINRWAMHGVDFIRTVCDPKVMAGLSDEEFQALKSKTLECVRFLIGVSDELQCEKRHLAKHSLSCPECSLPGAKGVRTRQIHSDSSFTELTGRATVSAPNTSLITEDDDGIIFNASSERPERMPEPVMRMDIVNRELQEIEKERNEKLQSDRMIGRVVNMKTGYDYSIKIRRVNFKWQRGIKLGEGSFGKVYSAVNMDTGELMAMKELTFQPNDHQRIKEIADEIKNCEGISDPYLVKYYGIEVHRDEMLIFMEYCAGGTIAEVARAGMSEDMVRRYTLYICKAINVLHEHGIAHRDVKGANIFLTENGLKLGDFGCSVKLKEHTTLVGEFNTVVGTMAYAAPEVITHQEHGHGRAADIWSLGCVVIEMSSGKRPWHDLEHNMQIMFKVGMGGSPPVPECLSEEGQDFVARCLISDPRKRWTASQLLDHPFVKVYLDED